MKALKQHHKNCNECLIAGRQLVPANNYLDLINERTKLLKLINYITISYDTAKQMPFEKEPLRQQHEQLRLLFGTIECIEQWPS